MTLADEIANLIEHMIGEGGGSLELRRNDLAGQLSCVPSQITYVIASRFTPERGYFVESHRGGGGCIRITRRISGKAEYITRALNIVSGSVDKKTAEAVILGLVESEAIGEREGRLLNAAASFPDDDATRAALLRRLLLTLA